MSHHQLSSYTTHGLEYSETDFNAWKLALWTCVSSDTLQVGERRKLYKEENDVIKSNEYWLDKPWYFYEKD